MPKLIPTRRHRQRTTRPSAANRTPAMAHSCRYAAGGAGRSYGTITRGLGREPQSRPRTATGTTLRPYHTRDLTSGGVYHKRPGPGYAVCVQARVEPAGLGALPAPPLYCAERPPVDRPDGAKSAVGMCGPRVTQGPLPVGHRPLRATTIPGVCGPRGPPMAH